MRIKRPAQIVASTLCVLCPYCGEPQPNPDNGADEWLAHEVEAEAQKPGNRTCNACDEEFRLHRQQKVTVIT